MIPFDNKRQDKRGEERRGEETTSDHELKLLSWLFLLTSFSFRPTDAHWWLQTPRWMLILTYWWLTTLSFSFRLDDWLRLLPRPGQTRPDQARLFPFDDDYDETRLFFSPMMPISMTPSQLDNKVSWCSWLSHHLDVVRVPGSNPGGTIFTWLINTWLLSTSPLMRCPHLTPLDLIRLDMCLHFPTSRSIPMPMTKHKHNHNHNHKHALT